MWWSRITESDYSAGRRLQTFREAIKKKSSASQQIRLGAPPPPSLFPPPPLPRWRQSGSVGGGGGRAVARYSPRRKEEAACSSSFRPFEGKNEAILLLPVIYCLYQGPTGIAIAYSTFFFLVAPKLRMCFHCWLLNVSNSPNPSFISQFNSNASK